MVVRWIIKSGFGWKIAVSFAIELCRNQWLEPLCEKGFSRLHLGKQNRE